MKSGDIPELSQAELQLIVWFRNLPCGHRALLQSALLAASADIENTVHGRGSGTAAARIGAVQGDLLKGLANSLAGLSYRKPADTTIGP